MTSSLCHASRTLVPTVFLLLLFPFAGPGRASVSIGPQSQITEISQGDLAQLLQAQAVSAQSGVLVQADSNANGDAPGDKQEADPRQQRLSTLLYDRRPSAILKAWSTPAPKLEGDPDALDEPNAEDDSNAEHDSNAEGDSNAADESKEGAGETLEEEALVQEPAEAAASDEGAADAESVPEETEALTEEELAAAAAAAAAKAEAEEAAAEAKAEAKRKAAEKKAIDAEIEALERNVTLGAWEDVRDYLASIDEEAAKAGYKQLLTSLSTGPPPQPGQFQRWAEKNAFGAADVTGLAGASPDKLNKDNLLLLGNILKQSLAAGTLIEEVLVRFREGLKEESPALRHQAIARLLFAAGRPLEAGEFLPPADKAIKNGKRAVLNLVARYEVARFEDEKKCEFLSNAWRATQAVLLEGEVEEEVKTEALERAVLLAPQVREELGEEWLNDSFSARPQRGMEILTVVGSKASTGLFDKARKPDERLSSLKLQTTAANALVAQSPELAEDWHQTLELLGANWLEEAEYSYQNDASSSLGPRVQFDPWGNVFYSSWGSRRNNTNAPMPISSGDILEIRPSDAWLANLDRSIRPKYDIITAQLFLKVNEEAEAFPYIEHLATNYPKRAKDLVDEFLRVWTENHNPNSNQRRTNNYMYMYGYDQRAGGIPLTRSKQERNLKELAEWVKRLRALPIESVDQTLLAKAFTNAHSSVEVYRLETIERVFGALDELDPEVLAELVQRMRSNLAKVWRDPAAQKDAGTKRRKKDIQNEVLRGYEVARTVVSDAIREHPGEWHLVLARASVSHDENNYRQELEKSPEFSSRRNKAFEDFRLAASLYREGAEERDEKDESIEPYTTWFYAMLGASDLDAIDAKLQPALGQVEGIREELQLLGGEIAERHIGNFAAALFTRLSNVNPAVKFRYIRAGLDIAGDHERGKEAREMLEFYDDLVTEILLDAHVDGSTRVGGDQPFGLYVDLHHTLEIEREAGGFGKYLVNQNNQAYGFNYGRPTENYREKFEETAREALQEHFDVQSVTFNHPDAHSIALQKYGWRKTPYAYILLKPRGPEIDRIPSLRMDLDFLDTSGYVVLPVESAPVSIDATQSDEANAICEQLQITQTLDERQAKDGKLILEVRAQALGRVPDLDHILKLHSDGFEIATLEDQGLSITKFDEKGDGSTIRSERIWMINFAASEHLTELPKKFVFGKPEGEDVEMEFQRYADADLVQVEPELELSYSYGEVEGPNWLARSLVLAAVLGLGWFGFRRIKQSHQSDSTTERFGLPATITPFSVIGLLCAIEAEGDLSEGESLKLRDEIDSLQKHYFEDGSGPAPDLEQLASTWSKRAS